mgnify:CR=1 FL=1
MLRLAALLPCYSVDDLELERREEDAEQLLGAWSALWHPALLLASGSLPNWHPAGSPPTELADHLILVPDCCQPQLPENWRSEAEAAGGIVLERFPNRAAMLAAALQHVPAPFLPADGELVADFLALGYCHLQIEILTRKLRYMSNVDESAVQTAALAAATAALAGDEKVARNHLQTAFDRLHDARDYYHPVETRLLDLTLVAPTTLGPELRKELASETPRNLLISAAVVEQMAEKEPDTLQTLQQALSEGRAALVGGEFHESYLPLLDPNAMGEELQRGLSAYEQHLGQRPAVFGRRRYGLTPVLPQILKRQGFSAALHCTLDEGRFPVANPSRIQWEGSDGTTIEALGCVPLDAGRTATFLQLAEKLSDAMSLDAAATIVFAHWPGQTSPWYQDVQRIGKYGSVLGDFSTITVHFEETSFAGHLVHHKPDEYRSPWLRQQVAAGQKDPVSRWVRYFDRRAKREAAQTIARFAQLCGSPGREAVDEGREAAGSPRGAVSVSEEMAPTSLAPAIHDALVDNEHDSPELDTQIEQQLSDSVTSLATAIAVADPGSPRSTLVINPCSFAQPVCLPSPPSRLPCAAVPGLGFSWLDPQAERSPPQPTAARRSWFGLGKAKEPPPLAEENLLRNEFGEIHFDRHTGAIRSIFDYSSCRPRLAQQIALRTPRGSDPAADENYSIMSAEEVRVMRCDLSVGEMLSRGRLMNRSGEVVARFQQITRVRRGSPVIEILIDLEIDRLPSGNPWESYYAVRLAWKDEMATLHGSANLANMATELRRIESPYFVDIREGKLRTTLLCGGLPFHRRIGDRKLDTLLVVPGETARSFRLGIALDVPQPMAAALGFVAPPCLVEDVPCPPTPSGWLFHLDSRNVVATRWEPLPGKPGNFRVQFLETDGQGVMATLRCFKQVRSAQKINPPGVPPLELNVEGDRIRIPVGPHQLAEVEVELI